ncbi:hypothetical protein LTS15_010974 [Exophiala xenobiotica]|nr:hypothetical protein LTS15_010974 [Exophiala xenobiotica]
MESIPPQVNSLLGAFSPILFVAQYVFNATGINLGNFETQLLSFVVVIAGLAYGYPICRDFVDKWMMAHVTLEGSDISYGYAAMFIRDRFGEKGRDLTVMSVRMNEENDAIPNTDGFADLTKFQWMRRYMPGFGNPLVPLPRPLGAGTRIGPIPYRRGYMLEGPPGTGKSSLVQALTGFFGLSTYLIPLLSKDFTEDNLASLFAMLPARCVVLFEDIDTAGIVVRTLNDGKLECTTKDNNDDKRGGIRCNISLAGLLNIIDGVGASEGRILVMTTNRIEKLDKAILRPGRIDFTVRFDLATDEAAKTLFERLYEDCPGMSEELAAALGRKFGGGKHSPAVIQSFVMQYPHDPQEAFELADLWIEENVAEEKTTYIKIKKEETD